MNLENASLLIQLIDSMIADTDELEKNLEKNKAEKFNKTKEELLKFQKQISDML